MAVRLKIDPITRIEGHLAIYLDIEGDIIRGAEVRGEMFRGFEAILVGRDPLDAQQITQRICGVCPISHGLASIAAQEMVYRIQPPENGRLIRNLIQGANLLQSHITHFYQLSGLDYVDMEAIVKYKGNDPELTELKNWVNGQVSSGAPYPGAPFLPRYAGDYITNPEFNFLFIKHYFEALKMRALCHQMGAIFAGKLPHAPTIAPGGVTEQVTTMHIARYQSMLTRVRSFMDTVYLPDVVELALAFPHYFQIGKGCGNLLAVGGYPESAMKNDMFLPAGVMLGGMMEAFSPEKIREDIQYAFYSSASKLHPGQGRTVPAPNKDKAYSWLKAPRYDGKPMEAGPLASVMLSYLKSAHSPDGKALAKLLKRLNQDVQSMYSVWGRHIARAVQGKVIADRCAEWLEQLVPGKAACIDFSIPASGEGVGFTEAPRGALGHWIRIEKYQIAHYQCVIPTTWNCSPKDDHDIPGPLEQALVGTRVADGKNPLEATRIIRSYDPCIACAVH